MPILSNVLATGRHRANLLQWVKLERTGTHVGHGLWSIVIVICPIRCRCRAAAGLPVSTLRLQLCVLAPLSLLPSFLTSLAAALLAALPPSVAAGLIALAVLLRQGGCRSLLLIATSPLLSGSHGSLQGLRARMGGPLWHAHKGELVRVTQTHHYRIFLLELCAEQGTRQGCLQLALDHALHGSASKDGVKAAHSQGVDGRGSHCQANTLLC
mmetsp:Transcript_28046/g.75762  ORF Transcript_28046/g.75762 Transcript_28046/m.75762 type:complete len:212 (-) Transcript_28046:2581-3216(-)